jgi:tetratricopeptide (TPR) repeat protein
MPELNDEIFKKITDLSEEGETLFEDQNFNSALKKYNEALDLIPLPKSNWEASTWLYGAIADVQFSLGEFNNSCSSLFDALNCPDGMGNAFLHLRLGQCMFELKEFDKAEDNLMRAYMLEGIEFFEEDDSKYLEFLHKKYKL